MRGEKKSKKINLAKNIRIEAEKARPAPARTDKAKSPKALKTAGVERAGGEAKVLTVQLERNKMAIMWAGVSFFMIIIFAFWMYNTTRAIKATFSSAPADSSLEEFNLQLERNLTELEQGFQEIRDQLESVQPEISTSSGQGRDIFSPLATTTEPEAASSTGAQTEEVPVQ